MSSVIFSSSTSAYIWVVLFFCASSSSGRFPAIDIESEFTQAQPLYPYEDSPINTSMQIIEKNGLQQVLNGGPYKWLNYNCQSFVNRAIQNKNKSEAVGKCAGGIFVTLLVIFGIKAFSNSKYKEVVMAKNGKIGDGHRNGRVDNRSQVINPKTHLFVKKRYNHRTVYGHEN